MEWTLSLFLCALRLSALSCSVKATDGARVVWAKCSSSAGSNGSNSTSWIKPVFAHCYVLIVHMESIYEKNSWNHQAVAEDAEKSRYGNIVVSLCVHGLLHHSMYATRSHPLRLHTLRLLHRWTAASCWLRMTVPPIIMPLCARPPLRWRLNFEAWFFYDEWDRCASKC